MWGRQPPPAKRFVPRGSEPSARQAERVTERSGMRGCGGGSPHLRLRNPEGGLQIRNHTRVRECKCVGQAPADRAAGIALGRAGGWGQCKLSRIVFFVALGIHQTERQRRRHRPSPQSNNAMRRLSSALSVCGSKCTPGGSKCTYFRPPKEGNKNPVKDFCWWDLDGVLSCPVCLSVQW
jgi:hypothetical protein